MKIVIIKCLSDNFSYLLINEKNLDTCVVDPSEAKPVLEYIENNDLNLRYILNTHHHGDHIGGNNILKNKFNAKILAFENDKDRIPSIDIFLKDNNLDRNCRKQGPVRIGQDADVYSRSCVFSIRYADPKTCSGS